MNMPMPMPQPNTHGFSLVGKKSLVLSHIPMFMPPHQAQLFLDVTLSGSGGQDPTKIYLDDQAATKTTDYVLLSDPIVLPMLAPDAKGRLTSFTGALYRGWPFNTPNTAPVLAQNVTVNITRAIYFQVITGEPPLVNLTYLAFATPESEYLVHKLVQPADLTTAPVPPDFCQILSAKLDGEREKLRNVQEVQFPGVTNNLANRLQAAQSKVGEIGAKKVTVRTDQELIYDPNHLT